MLAWNRVFRSSQTRHHVATDTRVGYMRQILVIFSGTIYGISKMPQCLASAVFASGEIVSKRVAKTLLTCQSDSFHRKKKSHNHSLKLLDHMNWNTRRFPSPYSKKSEFTSNGIYINQTKPFNENSASLTVKRVKGLSYLTVFTARRKQSRIPSKSLDLRTGKASLHVYNYNNGEVILTFITFA